MVNMIEYNEFVETLENRIYKNSKANLINKIADNPSRYIGLLRPTKPEMKLIQNITQSHEISFGDFVEDIMTEYLGKFYKNFPKKAVYNGEDILFDQLFMYENKVYMVEQKMRDDHDSTKKRGQYDNFKNKMEYLINEYPDNKITGIMWFVDSSLKKNKRYYTTMMKQDDKYDAHLFYGNEFPEYLDKISIWDEFMEYLIKWKLEEANEIELNFEKNWEDTKIELLENVSVKKWKKIAKNGELIKNVMPILFPTGKYKEILSELGI